jgi:uncharacterized protein YggL (DUF469 family)
VKKRIRKKKRLGEFSEWGVSVVAKLCIGESDSENVLQITDKILDDFIAYLEGNGWYCGGSITPRGDFDFVVEFGRDGGKLSQNIETLTAWLTSNPHLSGVVVSQPINLWYPPKEML